MVATRSAYLAVGIAVPDMSRALFVYDLYYDACSPFKTQPQNIACNSSIPFRNRLTSPELEERRSGA